MSSGCMFSVNPVYILVHSNTRLDLYSPKPYQTGFLMFLNVLNERKKMNDDR